MTTRPPPAADLPHQLEVLEQGTAVVAADAEQEARGGERRCPGSRRRGTAGRRVTTRLRSERAVSQRACQGSGRKWFCGRTSSASSRRPTARSSGPCVPADVVVGDHDPLVSSRRDAGQDSVDLSVRRISSGLGGDVPDGRRQTLGVAGAQLRRRVVDDDHLVDPLRHCRQVCGEIVDRPRRRPPQRDDVGRRRPHLRPPRRGQLGARARAARSRRLARRRSRRAAKLASRRSSARAPKRMSVARPGSRSARPAGRS